MAKKKTEETFMGVCAKLSDALDMDVFFVRVIMVFLLLATFPLGVMIYFLLGMFAVGE